MIAVVLVAIPAFGGALSCGTSDEDACRHYWEVICAREAECDPHYFSVHDAENVDTCVERLALTCPDVVALPNTNFHADAVSACSDALAQLTCDEWQGPDPEVCLTALRGTLQPGDACVSNFQCPSILCLAAAGSTSYFSCGTCAPLVEAGGACDRRTVCDTGLHCANKVCTISKQLGEQCFNADDCDVGLSCLTGTCSRPRALGDVCSNDRECNAADEQYCDPTTETCTPLPISYWRGDCALIVGNQVVYECRAGFYCDINVANDKGHCEPQLPDGETCAGSAVDPCIPPARCTAGVCALPEIPACTPP